MVLGVWCWVWVKGMCLGQDDNRLFHLLEQQTLGRAPVLVVIAQVAPGLRKLPPLYARCGICQPQPPAASTACRPADITNLAALRNLGSICAIDLPLTLHVLSHIPIVVSSRRSPISGSPTNVIAKLWLTPTPSASSGEHNAAAPQPQAQQGQQQQLQQEPAGLRLAMAQGIQESFD